MKYSLIIVGKHEEKYICNLLKELSKLPEKYEVIFVFPKDDPTWTIIKKEMRRSYKIVFDGGNGPGPARNLGFENSSGKYLLFIDADCWLKAEDMKKLLYLIEKLNNVAYIYPKLIHMPKYYPKYFTKFGNILLGDLIGWPFFILFNNILNAPLTLTNVFVCRREEFVPFKSWYPGEDLDFGYRLKKKTKKKFKITYLIKAYTTDRRIWNKAFSKFLRALSAFYTVFLYLFHCIYFLFFKKPLPLLKYRWIR